MHLVNSSGHFQLTRIMCQWQWPGRCPICHNTNAIVVFPICRLRSGSCHTVVGSRCRPSPRSLSTRIYPYVCALSACCLHVAGEGARLSAFDSPCLNLLASLCHMAGVSVYVCASPCSIFGIRILAPFRHLPILPTILRQLLSPASPSCCSFLSSCSSCVWFLSLALSCSHYSLKSIAPICPSPLLELGLLVAPFSMQSYACPSPYFHPQPVAPPPPSSPLSYSTPQHPFLMSITSILLRCLCVVCDV